MRAMWAAILMSVLAACAPPAPEQREQATAPEGAVAANGCAAQVSAMWAASAQRSFIVEAVTTGETCADSWATITIRDESDAVAHVSNYAASSIRTLSGAESIEDMQRRLGEWITPAGASMDSTGDLAAWAEGAAAPSFADVPFQPAQGITRAQYETLRAADAPMYCYEQSMESGICFAVRDGALGVIGVQTYAG